MQQCITLPYMRTSPVQLPRRDLVLSASDSLALTVTVVERDHPSAQLLILSTAAGGPSMQLVLWEDLDQPNLWCDYRRPGSRYGTVLHSSPGVASAAPGSWDFALPTGTFYGFPPRCGWSVLLLWDEGAKTEVLAQGIMHLLRPYVTGLPLSALPPVEPPIIPPDGVHLVGLLTDDDRPIWTSDTDERLETS